MLESTRVTGQADIPQNEKRYQSYSVGTRNSATFINVA